MRCFPRRVGRRGVGTGHRRTEVLCGDRVGVERLREPAAQDDPDRVGQSDELLEVGIVLRAAPLDTCFLTMRDPADPNAAARRRAWLGE